MMGSRDCFDFCFEPSVGASYVALSAIAASYSESESIEAMLVDLEGGGL